MSNTKHAPGPWHVAEWEVRDSDGAVEVGGWQVVGADGYAINTCISEGDGEQEEANLHFIVRACNSREHWAKWIVRSGAGLPDHACAECVPGGELVRAGFQCVYHEALAAAGSA